MGSSSSDSCSPRRTAALWSRCADIHRAPVLLPATRVCGSQEAQDQSSCRPASQNTPTVRSAGPQCTLACASRLRARASAPSRSPTMPTTPASDRSATTGAAVRRLSAIAAFASSSSFDDAARWSTSGRHGASPVPACRLRKSSSSDRRCQRSVVGRSARRTTVAGSGTRSCRRAASTAAAAVISPRKVSTASVKRVSSSLRFLARRCFCSNHMPIAVTGLSSANSAKRASPSRSTIAPRARAAPRP